MVTTNSLNDRAASERAAWQSLTARSTTGAATMRGLAQDAPDDARTQAKASALTRLAEHVATHPFDPDGVERVTLRQMIDAGLENTTGGEREAFVTLNEYIRTI